VALTTIQKITRASVGVLAAGMLVGMAAPAAADTGHAPSKAAPEVSGVFEVTGSGTAITIDTDPPGPAGSERYYSVPLGWHKSFTAASDVDTLQIVVVGGHNVGCRIVFDGKVVAEQPPGGSAHCIYQRNG
jgi:hypothetical protein